MSDGAASTELLTAAKDAAARNTDYYALLDLSPDDALTRDSVQRAWRRRSLMYHPDKAGPNFDAAKWEEFGLARDILASDDARAAYDAARAARLQKQRERDLMNSKQRRFAEELERAEAASGSGSVSKRAREQQEAQTAEEEREKGRQAAEGRRYMEERKRKLAEAEERERARERREDEERDDRIRELEGQIADKARRRAEKRAKREARKSAGGAGAGAGVDEEEDIANKTMLATTTTTTTAKPTPDAALSKTSPISTDPHRATASTAATTVPMADVKMSDDPIQFWQTQWPKIKARLVAAQATKERRRKETQAAA